MKKSSRGRSGRLALTKLSRHEGTSAGLSKDRHAKAETRAILIVADRQTDRQVLVALLAQCGHRLFEAKSGAEAIKIARKERPDLVIVDVLMPKMDGYAFVRKLCLDRKIAHTPVVFYTAHYIEEESRKLAKACGIRHIIVKPVDGEEALEMVDEALALRPRPSRSLTTWALARKHLRAVTEKVADKVREVEELNIKLHAEVSKREQIVNESLLAHAEARHAKEEAERANRAKDNFLATLSHELRTPLTPVLMCATALEQETSIEPEFRAQLGMIRHNVELEARLIDDLLDLTRVAHNKLQLVRSGPIDIHSLLLHTKRIVGSDAREKSVDLQFDLTANECHVGGDAARLQQVFWNLIKNAIKFTPRGGRVAVRTLNPGRDKFVLVVEDTGAGITPQTLPLIFRPFEQGETREAKSAGGLGLGLAISKAIVELHGGTIRAKSAGPGLGATFTVELGAVLPFPIAQATEKEPRPQTNSPCLRLLVVEDHEPTTEVLAHLLRRRGHDVLTAETVKRALVLASTHSFDLVISDLGLPDGNGIDLMQQLTREYGLRGIALSGYGMPDDRAMTRRAGFMAHLVKPINFDQLQCVLQGITRTVESKTTAEAMG